MSFVRDFIAESIEILKQLDPVAIENVAQCLATVRQAGGRVFVLGVGGSAASASHFVNDLRKLTAIEAYAPTDNVSELTARINDEGWAGCFAEWLKGSHLRKSDLVFVLSVGGGDQKLNVSPNLVAALAYAREQGACIAGIVGRTGGYTAEVANACVIIPPLFADRITPHTEAMHSVVGHLLVSHPKLKANTAKWESMAKPTCAGGCLCQG
jgi:D-sedoheptulose 7-phosphate isomerase